MPFTKGRMILLVVQGGVERDENGLVTVSPDWTICRPINGVARGVLASSLVVNVNWVGL